MSVTNWPSLCHCCCSNAHRFCWLCFWGLCGLSGSGCHFGDSLDNEQRNSGNLWVGGFCIWVQKVIRELFKWHTYCDAIQLSLVKRSWWLVFDTCALLTFQLYFQSFKMWKQPTLITISHRFTSNSPSSFFSLLWWQLLCSTSYQLQFWTCVLGMLSSWFHSHTLAAPLEGSPFWPGVLVKFLLADHFTIF